MRTVLCAMAHPCAASAEDRARQYGAHGGAHSSRFASLIETPDTRVRFTLATAPSLTFDELPELGRVTQMLFQLVGAPDIGYLKRLLTAAQRENLGSTLRDFTAPTAAGTLVRHNE